MRLFKWDTCTCWEFTGGELLSAINTRWQSATGNTVLKILIIKQTCAELLPKLVPHAWGRVRQHGETQDLSLGLDIGEGRRGSVHKCCSPTPGWCSCHGTGAGYRERGRISPKGDEGCSPFSSRINNKLAIHMELHRIWAVLAHKINAFSPGLFPQKWEKHL